MTATAVFIPHVMARRPQTPCRNVSIRDGEFQLRSRRWPVEEITQLETPGRTPLVTLACADDNAQGQALHVFWDCELDRRILEEHGWGHRMENGFDDQCRCAAFLHHAALHCVAATSSSLFRAPFRARIRPDAYEMEPLHKALRLLRVTLFITDDTGTRSYVSEPNRGRLWQSQPAASAAVYGNRRRIRAARRLHLFSPPPACREAATPRAAAVREAVCRRASK